MEAIKANGINIQKGILFHSASMVELTAIKSLIKKHLQEYPDIKLCITSSTVSSCLEANNISPKV
ncbi:MAG: glycosyltransferase N-terminal domain-containing protein, partial [Candidatus Cloacimonetes bacterium]|nr:glycosyltransferase N-terminal domain-containing protein [Candidatus Cloacimonadota bacterium]